MSVDKNLYVIANVFNPFGFQSRYRLYERFKRHMEVCGARLLTVEAAFGDAPFVVTTPGDPMHVQLRTNQVLWHKERLINLGRARLSHVVPGHRYVAWIDADVTFANPDWVAQAVHQLSHLAVIQPFSMAANLDSKGDVMWTCPSAIKSFIDGRGYHQEPPLPISYTYKGHPGLAWCATREALDAMGGLYDTCASGSADTVISNALKGDWDAYLPGRPSPGMRASMAAWATRAQEVARGRIGYTPGTVLHHWHGRSDSRGYEKRWSILSFHRFDPETDLSVDSQDMLKWAGNKPRLEDDIRYSLSLRNEDEL